MVIYIIMALIAYVIGSINFSVIISKKVAGFDVREKGSGNAGSTNMLRSVGKKAAALTLVCDILKGVVSIVIAIIVAVVVSKKGKNDTPQTNNPTAAQVETTVAAGNENVTTVENGNEDLPVAGDETTAKNSKSSKKSNKKGIVNQS